MDIQALIPSALAALHNFIRVYDPEEIHMYDDDELFEFPMALHPESVGELGRGPATSAERARANERRDKIAAEMWQQYQDYLENIAACDGQ
jgi:hypothetical protein